MSFTEQLEIAVKQAKERQNNSVVSRPNYLLCNDDGFNCLTCNMRFTCPRAASLLVKDDKCDKRDNCTFKGEVNPHISPKRPMPEPLGLKPKTLWLCERLKDIGVAISNYEEADKEIPLEWLNEFNEISQQYIKLKKNN